MPSGVMCLSRASAPPPAPAAPARDPDPARAELARRYLGGYGPATRADFTTWSGLPAADTARAWALIADEAVTVTAAGTELTALAGAPLDVPPPQPRLLGHFDPLLMGYRDRDLVLDPAWTRRIQAGGGLVQPTVLAGGRVAGTWRLDRRAARLVVEPFTPLPPDTRDALADEATDVGSFFGLNVTFQLADQP